MGLVVVHAHGNGRADGCHGGITGGSGAGSVCAVVGVIRGEHVEGSGHKRAGKRCFSHMVGDVHRDGGGELDALAASVGSRSRLGIRRLRGVLRHGRGALTRGGLGLGLDVLRFRNVGRHCSARIGFRFLGGGVAARTAAVVVARSGVRVARVRLLIELCVDVVGGLVVALLLVRIGDDGLVGTKVVHPVLEAHDSAGELGEVAREVRTHGGRGAHGLVLGMRSSIEKHLAGCRAGALEVGGSGGCRDIDGNGSAHGSRLTACEAGCFRQGRVLGLGVDGHAVIFAVNFHGVNSEGGYRFVALALRHICADRLERAVRFEDGLGDGIDDVQRDGGIEGEVLLVGCGFRVLERIGASDAEGLRLIIRGGMQVETTHLDGAVLADLGIRFEVCNNQGERSTHANALVLVGIRSRRRGSTANTGSAGARLAIRGRCCGGAGISLRRSIGVLVGSAAIGGHRGSRHGVEGVGALGGDGHDAAGLD